MSPTKSVDDSASTISMDNHRNDSESGKDFSLSLADDSYSFPPFSKTPTKIDHGRFILNSEEDFLDSPPARVLQATPTASDSNDVSFHYNTNDSCNTSGDGVSFTTNMSLEASLEEERQRIREKNRTKGGKKATPLFAFREPVLSQVDEDEKDNSVLSRAFSANSATSMANDDEAMPTFTPVDLDLGSLEVMNDPSLYAVAQAQHKGRTTSDIDPETPQLALQYSFTQAPEDADTSMEEDRKQKEDREEKERGKEKEKREKKKKSVEDDEELVDNRKAKKSEKEKERKEKEKEQKEREQKEKEQKEREQKEREQKEREQKEKEEKEKREKEEKRRKAAEEEESTDNKKGKRTAANEKEKAKQDKEDKESKSRKSRAKEEKGSSQKEKEKEEEKKKGAEQEKKDAPVKDKRTIQKELQMERAMERERMKREAEMARERKEREAQMAKEKEAEERKRQEKKEKKKLLQKPIGILKNVDRKQNGADEETQKDNKPEEKEKEKEKEKEIAKEESKTEKSGKAGEQEDKKEHEEEKKKAEKEAAKEKEEVNDKKEEKEVSDRKAIQKIPKDSPQPPAKKSILPDMAKEASFVDHVEGSLGDTTFNFNYNIQDDEEEEEEKKSKVDKKRNQKASETKKEEKKKGAEEEEEEAKTSKADKKGKQKASEAKKEEKKKEAEEEEEEKKNKTDKKGKASEKTGQKKKEEEEEEDKEDKTDKKGKQKASETKKEEKKKEAEEEEKRKKREEKGKGRVLEEPSLQAQTPFSDLPRVTRNYKSKKSEAPTKKITKETEEERREREKEEEKQAKAKEEKEAKAKKEREAKEKAAKEKEEKSAKSKESEKEDKGSKKDKKGKKPAEKSEDESEEEGEEGKEGKIVNKKRTLPFSLDDLRRTRRTRPEKEKTKPEKEFDSPEDSSGWTKKKRAKSEEKSPSRKRSKSKEKPERKRKEKEMIDEVEANWDSSDDERGSSRGRRSLRITNKRKRFVVEATQDENDWITDEIIGSEEEAETTKGKKKIKAEKSAKSDKAEDAEDDGAPGPSTKPNTSTKSKKTTKNIFKGISFAFTGITKNESNPDSEQKLKALVKSHGGTLLDTHQFQANPNPNRSPISKKFKNAEATKKPKTVLISDQSHQTLKYIMAVAGGTPCVHFNWINECCSKEALVSLEPHLLPSGTLIDDDEPVFIKSASSDIFRGLRVEVIGASDFKDGWSKVLRTTGAKVVQRMFTEYEDRVECVLSDPMPDKILLKRADKLCIPVVSATWLIQSILKQKPVPYDAHPSYFTFHAESAE